MYTTELMQKILTSPMAQEIVNQLAPIYGEARVALWIFQAIGIELDDMREWTLETQQQVVPQTATWSLDYWEDEYAIPRDPTLSTEGRRERIVTYKQTRAPMNPYRLERVASSAAGGAKCRVEERTGAGSVFTLYVNGFPGKGVEDKVRAAVDRAKQARLSYLIKYEENTQGSVYAGGAIQMGYSLTMTQT